MAQPAEGFHEEWQQYITEAEYGTEECDECGDEFADGETYWSRDDEFLCESCFAEWRED